MQGTNDPSEGNPLELEARAFELEAEAAVLRAKAKRLTLATAPHVQVQPEVPSEVTRAEFAKLRKISQATVTRLLKEGMPASPVGTRVRINIAEADAWLKQRGRKPTRAAERVAGLDVDDVLAHAGLRLVGNGGGR